MFGSSMFASLFLEQGLISHCVRKFLLPLGVGRIVGGELFTDWPVSVHPFFRFIEFPAHEVKFANILFYIRQ